jgi:hypothetical protein
MVGGNQTGKHAAVISGGSCCNRVEFGVDPLERLRLHKSNGMQPIVDARDRHAMFRIARTDGDSSEDRRRPRRHILPAGRRKRISHDQR